MRNDPFLVMIVAFARNKCVFLSTNRLFIYFCIGSE